MAESHNSRHDSMLLFHSLYILASLYVVLGAALLFSKWADRRYGYKLKSKLLLIMVWILLKMSHLL
jgi:hypothetical protein